MRTVIDRIKAKCVRNDRTGCLVWQGQTDEKGYGRIRKNGKERRIHRWIWEEEHGPTDAHVLHKCDNRRCAELAHLYAGDNAQNIADKCARDRSGKKLNIAKVRRIKAMLADGYSQGIIADRMGVNRSQVSRINTGARWKHVEGRSMASTAV